MQKTKIDWPNLDYTWNPVVGCKNNCSYCYARRMNDRFKFIKKWDEPEYFPFKLYDPYNIKKPSIIFVGSMCDLFGSWIQLYWIDKIIRVCRDLHRHTFMFLTKNHVGYNGFSFPDNCMLGITQTIGNQIQLNEFFHYSHGRRFVSIEPLMGSFEGIKFNNIELVIVGAMTGTKPVIPQKEWIQSIKHDNIYYKKNIQKYLTYDYIISNNSIK